MSQPARPGLHTIGRWASDRAARHPDRVAIEFAGRRITYRQLERTSSDIAARLAGLGLRRGDRVASITGNRPEHVELLLACAMSATALVPLNWRLAPAELAAQLEIVRPSLLVADAGHAATAAELCRRVGIPPPLAIDALPAALGALGAAPCRPEPPADEDALFVVFTSGSSGRPKGAVLSHRNCFFTNLSLDCVVPLRADDVVLQVLPQYHVGGWNVQPLQALMKGATLVLEADFDPARCLELIERRGITTTMGVPATYLMLAEEPAFERTDVSSLRTAIVGGAPMPVALLSRWQRRGVAIAQGYGLTEASPNVLCLEPCDAASRLGSAGTPYPFVEVELRDPASGARIEGPGSGEIHVHGPNVFSGYFCDEAATVSALRPGGWLATGDIAERDADGCYVVRGRGSEMYISGGENVYPAEVENALATHAGVVEAAVIGIPDDRWGERGRAYVVPRPGLEPTAAELLAHCRDRLAGFKVPREICFVTELPRTSTGKLDRRQLRTASEGGRALSS